MENCIYTQNGYDNRDHYLKCQAEWFGYELSAVKYLADILGENEDFDGLVTSLEDGFGLDEFAI